MTERAQILEMINLIPDNEIHTILEVIKHFIPIDIDDIATPDDIAAHEAALRAYEAGELIDHNDIDWD